MKKQKISIFIKTIIAPCITFKGSILAIIVIFIILELNGVNFVEQEKFSRPTFTRLESGEIIGNNWRVLLPKYWEEKDAANAGQWYFESQDGTKGVYISSYNIGTTSIGAGRLALDNAKTTLNSSLESMSG